MSIPRRSAFEIKVDLLRLAVEPIKPTNLMYRNNMSWGPLMRMVNELIEGGFLVSLPTVSLSKRVDRSVADKRSSCLYHTTPRGNKLLADIESGMLQLNPPR